MKINPKKNWTEDYQHENGQYFCVCRVCKEDFIGRKRRFICKECYTKGELESAMSTQKENYIKLGIAQSNFKKAKAEFENVDIEVRNVRNYIYYLKKEL